MRALTTALHQELMHWLNSELDGRDADKAWAKATPEQIIANVASLVTGDGPLSIPVPVPADSCRVDYTVTSADENRFTLSTTPPIEQNHAQGLLMPIRDGVKFRLNTTDNVEWVASIIEREADATLTEIGERTPPGQAIDMDAVFRVMARRAAVALKLEVAGRVGPVDEQLGGSKT